MEHIIEKILKHGILSLVFHISATVLHLNNIWSYVLNAVF